MSVSNVSPYVAASALAARSAPSPDFVRQGFNTLAKALQAGDLAGAQSAYTNLSRRTQNPATQSNPFAQALGEIGSALQSGNIAQAQQALSAVQTQLQTQPASAMASQSTSTSQSPAGSGVDVVA